jgi:hypothetical protein
LARHTLLQFLALALAGANCKCVWLLALDFLRVGIYNCFSIASAYLGGTALPVIPAVFAILMVLKI